jgi:hypothetical protein
MLGLPTLVEAGDLLPGSSSLLPTACTPNTGPANVDGRCIMGGVAMPAGQRGFYVPSLGLQATRQCVAFPVYLMNNVPYTNGRVAGNNYATLASVYTYTRLNEDWATNRGSVVAGGLGQGGRNAGSSR